MATTLDVKDRNAQNPFQNGKGRQGMTLIEVILSIGILVVVLMFTLLALMASVRLNRLTAREITASNAMRAQMEEVMTVARDNIDTDDNLATAVILYYGNQFDGEQIAIGPKRTNIDRVVLDADGNTLTYYFGIPEPGQRAREVVAEGNALPDISPRGVGQMVIYLTEAEVPAASSIAADWKFLWRDMGTNPNAITVDDGFDMNRDGIIDNRDIDGNARPKITKALLSNTSNFHNQIDIKQIPVDITITYYANPEHDRSEYVLSRRMIVL